MTITPIHAVRIAAHNQAISPLSPSTPAPPCPSTNLLPALPDLPTPPHLPALPQTCSPLSQTFPLPHTSLQAGDLLLLDTGATFAKKHVDSKYFSMILEMENSNPPR
jgi:hypothetical protein